jgi:hypothetical protein
MMAARMAGPTVVLWAGWLVFSKDCMTVGWRVALISIRRNKKE